jgi:hypothetical protein
MGRRPRFLQRLVDNVIVAVLSEHAGVTSPIAGQMFFRAVTFMSYGQSTAFVKSFRDGKPMRPIDFFVAGGIAQGIGVLSLQPDPLPTRSHFIHERF